MIVIKNNGDLLDSRCDVLVNTVNTVGVMGAGIAKQFKEKYPELYEDYRKICKHNLLEPGKLYLRPVDDGHRVLCFPTKVHWKNPSQYSYIEAGMKKFVESYQKYNIQSIAFPKLGCNNGKLNWRQVKQIMFKYLEMLPDNMYIEIYE